jgi:hypothetical protein
MIAIQFMRQSVGFVIIVGISFIINLGSLVHSMRDFELSAVGTDVISVYEKKFKTMKDQLPSKEVIGYIDDRFGRVNASENLSDSVRLIRRFYVTQYTLAPHLIENSIRHRFVIGNFIYHRNLKDAIPANAAIRMDFGGDLVLIKGLPE